LTPWAAPGRPGRRGADFGAGSH